MCHVNIRSAKKNMGSFENHLSLLDIEFTVIVVTETWFKEHDASLYDLDGCHIAEIHRVNRLDGVAIYIHTHLSFSVRLAGLIKIWKHSLLLKWKSRWLQNECDSGCNLSPFQYLNWSV